MRRLGSRPVVVYALLTSLAAAVLLVPLVPSTGTAATSATSHTLTVSGDEIAMFPAFSADVERYAVTTGPTSDGTVVVSAATSDPSGIVLVNGMPAPGGTGRVTGLEAGDEISVFIVDSAGTARHSLFYLPPEFPELARDTSGSATDPAPGHVLLTLGLWLQPSPFFETAVDANGVPVMVSTHPNSMDLKRQPNGSYSVGRGSGDGRGADIVELDAQFREIASYRTVGLHHTDAHDAILLPDGSRYLMAYEPRSDPVEGNVEDAIVQHISATGQVLFQWNSADHVDIPAETVVDDHRDYAHINSFDVMDDGDLLLSFRHLSAVFKVARHARPGVAEGDVVWRLGGRRSDFTFADESGAPGVGPCAQHTATELDNGDIMVFDNGAWSINPLCVDPSDRDGPVVARTPSRVAVWSLDAGAGEATAVRDISVPGRYAIFAGSAQPLAGDRTLVGWASETKALVSELAEDGTLLWELKVPGAEKYFTYRAFKQDVPDAIAPEVSVLTPAHGATYPVGAFVPVDRECTDRGGSSLWTCTAGVVDTSSPGTHVVTVAATDGAGNRTEVQRSYQVVAAATPAEPAPSTPPTSGTVRRPDALVRLAGGQLRGDDVYGQKRHQQVRASLTREKASARAVVRVQNDGTGVDRFRLDASASTAAFGVRLRWPGGSRTSPPLLPGETWTVRLRVVRRPAAEPGDTRSVRLRATSVGDAARRDAVWVRLRAR